MKVLIVIPCLLMGGTEMQTERLSEALVSFGFVVDIICYYEHDAAIVSELKRKGAIVRLLNMNRNIGILKFIRSIRREIITINPDVVHVQYMAPGALPIIAARLAGVKTVFATVHQPWTHSHGFFSKLILRTVSLMTTKFITVSRNAEKSWFGSASLLDETKPVNLQVDHLTINNAVDLLKIRKIIRVAKNLDLKRELNIPANIPIIGAVSRLRHEKGIDLLVEAFNLLLNDNIKAHLLLVGSGPDNEKLKHIAIEKGIAKNVTFYGPAGWETAISIMSIMDIVVVPSRFEGFGLTAAEAMAAGKPVVVSDTTGLKEVVPNEDIGILCPVGDTEALKRAMERLVTDADLRECFGKAGIERVKENFSIDIYRKKIKALYSI